MKVIEKLGKTDGTTLVLACSLPEKDLRMAEDLTALIEIVGGDHDPPHPFMVVRGHGFLIDLSQISGELWDQNNVASCA
jgi:hypothetical protein